MPVAGDALIATRTPRRPRFVLKQWMAATFGATDPRAFRLCGMDEVGRGAYAGPLVAAAVVLPRGFRHPLLRDSKQLTARQREQMAEVIRQRALVVELAEIGVRDINTRGMGWANVEIFRRLAAAVAADGFCCDGTLRIEGVTSLVRADDLVPAVSAASIVAKVHRDALMVAMHDHAPHFNWASNKGYGAAVHLEAIRVHGPHEQHRRVWIANLLQLDLALEPAGDW